MWPSLLTHKKTGARSVRWVHVLIGHAQDFAWRAAERTQKVKRRDFNGAALQAHLFIATVLFLSPQD
jgi:hypothetical protein